MEKNSEIIHEDIATVKATDNNCIYVELENHDSCNSCAISGMCNANKKDKRIKIPTEDKYLIGDKIKIRIEPKLRILSSLILFLFPILSMIIFYLIGSLLLSLNEDLSIIVSLVGLLLSGIIIYLIDKKLAAKLNFKIIEKINKE